MLRYRIKKARLKMYSLLSRVSNRAMVLMYHRVVNSGSDPQKLTVTPDNFEMQMDIISRHFHPISLQELTGDLANGSVRDRACVVTFDDGYEDNYSHASAILEKYGVPATIFISSGYSGTRREFWWDELERQILRNKKLPDGISIEVNGCRYHWSVSNKEQDDEWNVQSTPQRVRKVGQSSFPYEIYIDLCKIFQTLEAGQIDEALTQLRSVTGDRGEARSNYLPMSFDQLRDLSARGLIEIGAHTRSHVNLAAQTLRKQREEIEGGKRDLEELLGKSIQSFSYPFGTLDHYSDATINCVKDAGFGNALAGFAGNVSRFSSSYEIPRRIIRNWDGEVFGANMEQFYSG